MNMFSVMADYRHKEPVHATEVPWSFVEKHEEQAQTNHGQTLRRLNQRGGLGVVELWHVVNDKNWMGPLPHGARIEYADACKWLESELQKLSVTP